MDNLQDLPKLEIVKHLKLSHLITDSTLTPKIFEDKIINVRKRIKENLQEQTIEFIVNFYGKAVRMVTISKDIKFDFEKDLIKYFIEYKSIMYNDDKYEKLNNKRRNLLMLNLHQKIDEVITYIIYLHNITNILFNMINFYKLPTDKYVRNPMINFLKELELIADKKLIDGYLCDTYKQFNDIRNMFLHEDYFTLFLKLNVEDLKDILKLLKIIDYANSRILLINKEYISSLVSGQFPEVDKKLAMYENMFIANMKVYYSQELN